MMGLRFLSEPLPFELLYNKVRERENRIYEDELVRELPSVPDSHPHYAEWRIRADTCDRWLEFLRDFKPTRILDLGCGNGWFTDFSRRFSKASVIGLDINRLELEQASRLFPDCRFFYGDILKSVLLEDSFDLITLNSSVQYFPDIGALIRVLRTLLIEGGEIHFLDSPFYRRRQLAGARGRSEAYYRDLGIPDMTNHYFHHSYASIREFEPHISRPATFLSRLNGLFNAAGRKSAFPWIRIAK